MIRVKVKLFGTLPQRFRDYDREKGLIVELGQGASIMDLKDRLDIKAGDGGVVAIDGRVAKAEDVLTDGALVRIFQLAHGG